MALLFVSKLKNRAVARSVEQRRSGKKSPRLYLSTFPDCPPTSLLPVSFHPNYGHLSEFFEMETSPELWILLVSRRSYGAENNYSISTQRQNSCSIVVQRKRRTSSKHPRVNQTQRCHGKRCHGDDGRHAGARSLRCASPTRLDAVIFTNGSIPCLCS